MQSSDEVRFRVSYPYTSKKSQDKQDVNDHSAAVIGQTSVPQNSQKSCLPK